MNGKFLMLLFICFNIVSLLFSYGLYDAGNTEIVVSNFVLSAFIKTDLTGGNINKLTDSGGLELGDDVNDATNSLSKSDSAGTSSDSGFFSILDGLKMALGFISLLTPIPAVAFLISLKLPLFFLIMFGLPLVILYITALAEFVSGRKL